MDKDLYYTTFLKRRSPLGLLYRKYYLYPRLCRYLFGNVLDYGCGIGDFLKHRPNTIGVDINKYNIEYCIASKQNALLIDRGSALPFSQASFSGVILDNVLEHIPALESKDVLREISRVLESGGTLVIGVPGHQGYLSDPDHKTFYTKESLEKLVVEVGFSIAHVFYMPLNHVFLDRYLSAHCLYAIFRKSSI